MIHGLEYQETAVHILRYESCDLYPHSLLVSASRNISNLRAQYQNVEVNACRQR